VTFEQLKMLSLKTLIVYAFALATIAVGKEAPKELQTEVTVNSYTHKPSFYLV
jgi:hypothetical protein